MSEDKLNPENRPEQTSPEEASAESAAETERYPELTELQNEIDRRIRDNQKFLDHFLDETFPDDDEENGDDEEMQPEL